MRRFAILLLFVSPLFAGNDITKIRLEGAKKIAAVAAESHRFVRDQYKAGTTSADKVYEAQRADLDAQLRVATLEAATTDKPRFEPMIAIQRKIVELEAQWLKLARTMYKEGRLDALKVLDREETHVIAVRELDSLGRIQDAKEDKLVVAARVKKETAAARKIIADRRVELVTALYKEGQTTALRVNDAHIGRIEADTALAVATRQVELAIEQIKKLEELKKR